MLKNILNTIFTKVLTTFLSFLLVVLTTQYLGTSGRGAVSLAIAAVGICGLASGFIGGSTLVFLFSRYRSKMFLSHILPVCFGWAIVVNLVGSYIMSLAGWFPREHLVYVVLLGIISSSISVGSMILLAEQKIIQYNSITLVQTLLNVGLFSAMVFVVGAISPESYFVSLAIASGLALGYLLFSLTRINASLPLPDKAVETAFLTKEVVRLGFVAQVGNLVQYFNYRISYFFLNSQLGMAQVGIYSIGVLLSESIWMISGSIALVHYSKVAGMRDNEYSIALTRQLSMISLLITLACTLTLIVLPATVISYIFGKDFAPVKSVVISLSPGIVAFGFASIISHYFAGIGRYYINALSSLVGFAVTIGGNLLLIPAYGYIGAGMASSLSYCTSAVFLLVAYLRFTKTNLSSLRISGEDVQQAIGLVKSFIRSK